MNDRPNRATMDRRGFLKGATVTAGGLALLRLRWSPAAHAAQQPGFQPTWNPSRYSYTAWEDLYRNEWKFSSAGRSTHSVNCTGSCSWKVLVKNGVVWRDEQAADYPAISDSVPDYNPRGCQKGACASDFEYGRQRIKYPLKRVGKRGEGKWKRLSWDQVLTEIADKTLDIIQKHGPEYLNVYTPIPAMSPVSYASGSRLMNLLGGVAFTFYDWYSDLPPGEPITWGVQTDTAESADWFNSRYILVWGSNVNATRIPDAQMLQKARFRNGAKVVVISPEYNPTAVHADQFVPVRPGSDLAVALAMDHVIFQERLFDAAYIAEQTDLPFLVRDDTGHFLRESDLQNGGHDDVFYVWDRENGLTKAPKKSLRLENLAPMLEGSFEVDGTGGSLRVRPVFEHLRDELQDKTPEWGEAQSGLDAEVIRSLAREFAHTKPAMIIHGNGVNQWYHNDLANRAMILLTALTGNVGRAGGGFNHYVGQEKIWPVEGWKKLTYPLPQRFQNTSLWAYWHAEMWKGDPLWPELKPYLKEAVAKNWMPLWPNGLEGPSPKAMYIWRANWLNQAKGNEWIVQHLLPKLDMIVVADFRMCSTALYADYVLPTATWSEKFDLNMTDLTSFIIPFTPVVAPFAESKTDWQIFRRLSKKIEERAIARAFPGYKDKVDGKSVERDLTTLHDQFTMHGRLRKDKDAAQFILDHSVETKGFTFDDLVAQPRRFKATSEHWTSPIVDGEPYTPFLRYVRDKQPWPTLTKRQQFYIDAPWYLKLGIALPTYRAPLDLSKHPLRLCTPHYRHAISSTWMMDLTLQRLQWGEPFVWINPTDAKSRDIADHEWVRVFNDNGWLRARARLHPAIVPGQIHLPQGQEMVQFKDRHNFQAPIRVHINPAQLVQYGHLHFVPNYWGPTATTRDTLVDVKKA